MVEVIPLKYGVTFKRVFSDPVVFSQFASDVLGIPIKVDEVHTEYTYDEPPGYVNLQYDLFAEDKEKRTIIEVQHVREDDFFDRFLYYHLIALVEQVRSYAAYRFERTVYTIVVLTRKPQPKHLRFSYAISDMNPTDEFGDQIQLYPHRLVFLSPNSVRPETPERARPWLELIADSLDSQIEKSDYDSKLFQEIIARIERNTLSPSELAHIKDEAAWEDAKQNAREEGREEGRRATLLETARGMLANGIDVAVVANVTGLTVDEIEQLANSRNPVKTDVLHN